MRYLLILLLFPAIYFGQINEAFLLTDTHINKVDGFEVKTQFINRKVLVSLRFKEKVNFVKGWITPFKGGLRQLEVAYFDDTIVWNALAIKHEDYLDGKELGNMELTLIGMNKSYKLNVFTTHPPEGTEGVFVIVNISPL